ncbi:MAG: PTS sugar transporter subunit IIA [Deltaproteobacteria bacterium]|nr:PTS sugar transporter subunit IIA [Deltaproteobacteria bacterium]
MNLVELLPQDAIIVELVGDDVPTVFAELCAPMARSTGIAAHELVAALLEREALASTGIGHGLAIPTACTRSWRESSEHSAVRGPGCRWVRPTARACTCSSR